MSLIQEEKIRNEAIYDVAKKMMIAARTAPKGRGVDNLVIALADETIIASISKKMKDMTANAGWPAHFVRDADNILSSPYMILIGTKIRSLKLNPCGMCGFANCEEREKHPGNPCAFNTSDLGIAIGSAVSVAMDHKVDNRIMYTVGQAVKEMSLLSDEVTIIFGIPLSVSSKNPFFDRKPK